ncbi:hypothetical protein [Brevundimonas sp.]|jgi:hypothetical protein|uniref:hypothetical protein n=1 Tax=Brevundimonas sp. TaxID=1871086 RepID=UPI003784BC94
MSATRKIVIEVPEALALRLAAEVEDAGYENVSALVVESLEVHLDHSRYDGSNPGIESWLREQVLPTIERKDREKTPGIPESEVLARLKARRASRKSAA